MAPLDTDISDGEMIHSVEQLEAIYGQPLSTAIAKEIDHITTEYRAFIEAAPFVVIATSGADGLDCSPRGDPPGFVRVVDEKTILIPDRRGNNRTDTLHNLIHDPRISLLFLIPGVGETIRINGRAAISIDDGLRKSFTMQGKVPQSVLVVTAERVYYQCPKALIRSRLWSEDARVDRKTLPSAGDIMEAVTKGEVDGADYDAAYPERVKRTIY